MGVTHLYHGATPMAAPRKKRPDTSPAPELSTEGTPSVYEDVVIGLIPALQEIVAWWEGRKATLEQASDAGRLNA